MIYKITETTDEQYIGEKIDFNGDVIVMSEDFIFEWTDLKKSGKTLTVSNSNYTMTMEKFIS